MTFLSRIRFAVALSALALPVISAAAPGPIPAPQDNPPSVRTFKIAGTVVNALTGAPLSQVRVSIAETADRAKITSMTTSENGHFEFSQLPPGKFALQGVKRGFIRSAYQQHEQFSTAIVTGPRFATESLVLRLTPMAVITGHVFDESGDPIHRAQVNLYLEDHRGGMSRINRIDSSNTDDRGFYDFILLRPGNYYLSVSAKPWYAIHPTTGAGTASAPPAQVSPALDVAYPATFYDGATESDGATPIELKGGDRPQIDVHLNPVPALHVIFRIPAAGPDQQSGFNPPVFQKRVFDSEEFVATEGMSSVEPGVFEFTGVPPGRYSLRTKNPDSGQFEHSTGVDLTRDGQDLSLSRGEPLGALKLSLKMSGAEPLPKQYGVGLQDSRRRMVAFQRGDPSGQVSFQDLAPGKYAILIGSQAAYSVVHVSSPSGDSPGHDVNILPGAALELTAFLSTGTVSIEGVVRKKDHPVAGVMVVLVPKDPESHIELFRRDQSDFDGTFVVRSVIPGSYTIVAVEDAWGFDWLQPGILARYVLHGQQLTIHQRMRGSVHLPDPIQVQPH